MFLILLWRQVLLILPSKHRKRVPDGTWQMETVSSWFCTEDPSSMFPFLSLKTEIIYSCLYTDDKTSIFPILPWKKRHYTPHEGWYEPPDYTAPKPRRPEVWHIWWTPEEKFESRTVHKGSRNSYAWYCVFGADRYGTITFLHWKLFSYKSHFWFLWSVHVMSTGQRN